MEGLSLDSSVILVVKTPNRQIDDLQISCALNWTVEKIKQHLSSVYPSKPESRKQRLIYSGQLLLDHQTLKDFLREHQDGKQHTVHLVCNPSSNENLSTNPSSSSVESVSSSSSTMSNESTGSNRGTPSTPTQTTTQATMDGVRYRGQTTPVPPPFVMPNPQMWNMNGQYGQGQMFPQFQQQQLNHQLWMQHMQQVYQQQQHQLAAARQPHAPFMYMPPNMPHMQFWPQQMPVGMVPGAAPVNIPPPIPPQLHTPVPPPQPQNVPLAQPAQPRNPEVRMNAGGGGGVDDDEEEENLNHDWLDKVYTLSRIAILLSIVWFYSTTGRFLMLILSVTLIYMYQWGVFRWLLQNRNPQVINPPPQPVPPPQPQEPNQAVQVEEAAGENTEEGNPDNVTEEAVTDTLEGEAVPQPPPPPGPSTFRIAISFVSSFFTSLVPQNNEVFQGN